MDNAYSAQRRLGISPWSWGVGIIVLFVTFFFPPPLPVATGSWGSFNYILSGGGSFWQALHSMSIPPHFLRYYLTHYLWNIFSNDLLPICGFPLIWSIVSVGMWQSIVSRGQRPTARKGMLALFLADVIAWLIGVVVIGLIIWMISPKQIVPDSPVILPTLITEIIITIQAVLYLPFVLLAGALIAKLQARTVPATQ
ncbi:hypothetical protein [Ktedonobacter racemifer]|uniref:Uncharacterized protein n=1 Tax=Ktedonobacter racemifer DSM 44963 TaxID=485913 RepID=D6U5H2_KTERA|nr:hypothetical protein [Ktedonobacter racemifer]EFH81752.1 hypothetical protein Krac_2499 [Ktedonobacter racemifer DSM 44963]